jgi:hypothetical protein
VKLLSTKIRISTNGGQQPQWRADGREIFYLSPNRDVMAARVKPGDRPEPSRPVRLMTACGNASLATVGPLPPYDVSSDRSRFYFVCGRPDASSASMTVSIGWTAAIK